MKRLTTENLGDLASGALLPQYDFHALKPGIVHLGLGAFHRAHQAVFTDRAIELSGGDWGIVGVSMRSDTVARQLQPQNGLYSVLSEDQGGQQLQVIGVVRQVLVAPQEVQALDEILANPDIRVVTLTVTEKGYCLGEDGWSLDMNSQSVQADLAQPQQASTAIGILARGMARRSLQGGPPLTVISCDNLGENSTRLRAVLLQYLQIAFPDTVPWMEQAVSFPCSMVDRIVPAMTAAGLQRQAEQLGLSDEGAVATEPFSQWIIEDCFATEVPDWASAGAQLVADIRPFEEMKLRLLNASHTAIAFTGLLAGKETVADVMADPQLAGFIEALMAQELVPALDAPAGFDLRQYSDQLLQRFANPCLQHHCAQIAMDSTEKVRQRWLATLQRQDGGSRLLRSLACWCYFVLHTEKAVDDPRAEQLLALRASAASLEERLPAVLECVGIGEAPSWLGEERFEHLSTYVDTLEHGGVTALLGSA